MPIVVWNDSYSVSVRQCDEQHKTLFAIINELFDAMRVGKGRDAVGPTVDKLAGYTVTHFRAEEQLMRSAKYPDLVAHLALHKKFEDEVGKLKKDTDLNNSANSIAVLEFLKNWLSDHIMKVDRQYGRHLNEKGVY